MGEKSGARLIDTLARPVLILALGLLFAGALAVRLYDLTDLPLDFQPTRQLHSALIARGMYYQNLTSVPQWQRDMAVTQWKAEGLIEPQVIERMAAFTYRFTGEVLWIPRIFSILFWLLGGIALFLLARELAGIFGGLAALTFYLYLPYAIIASRAFMPDPLLVGTLCFALWAAYHWGRTRRWKWAIAAGLLSGLTVYIKAPGAFFVGGGLVGVVLGGWGLKKALRDPQVWTVGALAVIPYLAYLYYGTSVLHLLQSQFALRFFPQMWINPIFYLQWQAQIGDTIGLWALILAVIGSFFAAGLIKRGLLAGLWVGYCVYGMVFAYFMTTHDYYQLPLIPIVALGLAPLAEVVLRRLTEVDARGLAWVVSASALLFGVIMAAWQARTELKRVDYRGQAAFWAKLGEELHGRAVVALSEDYGYRLQYWGWLVPTNWMTSGDFNLRALAGEQFDARQLFQEYTQGKEFFLVTLFSELDRQPVLKNLLYSDYSIYDQGDGYVIFDLRHPLAGAQDILPAAAPPP